jgi:serine/threonine protein kinase
MQDLLSQKNFKIQAKIGGGSFGEIFEAIDLCTDQQFAIKIEKTSIKSPKLLFEAKLYNYLNKNCNKMDRQVPKVYQYLTTDFCNIMIMELMGPSLESLFSFCEWHFSLKTVLMLADQMINRLEFLHSNNFIHRDLKPANILIGNGKNSYRIFLIDFGLAKKFTKNGEHRPFQEHKEYVGTPKFSSYNSHLGYELSRRDDMESLGYILVYLLKGFLPWQNLKAKDKQEKREKIKEMKQKIKTEDLCCGLPLEFEEYLNYCKELKFDEKPDYEFLREKFRKLREKRHHEFDFVYDWNLLMKSNVVSTKFEDENKKIYCAPAEN